MKRLLPAIVAAIAMTHPAPLLAADPAPGAKPSAPVVAGELPSGHPDLASIQGKGIEAKLKIRVMQGTEGGKSPAGDAVAVELFSSGQVAGVVTGNADAQGELTFDKLTVPTAGAMPLVRVMHGKAEFQAFAPVISAKAKDVEVVVAVFESTEAQPAWQFKVRHVMVSAEAGGLKVLEMFAIENPDARAWVGRLTPAGNRQTFALKLTDGATDLGVYTGFIRDKVAVEKGSIMSFNAMPPGLTKYQIAYTLPVVDGKATLTFEAPAPTERLSVFAPAGGAKIVAEGLREIPHSETTTAPFRGYQAEAVPAGTAVKLVFEGVTPQPAAGGPADGLPAGHPRPAGASPHAGAPK